MTSSHQSNTWIGRLIGDRDRYRLESYLGGGGMGDVFLATDMLLGKQVALKLLKGALINTEAFSKRFAREVSLCAALKSDHIVQVSDYGMLAEGDPFYVMEYLEGETLGARLAHQEQLSPQQAIGIIVQVCKGLQVAHEGVEVWQKHTASSKQIKIVHRDLKPENIFLVPTVLGELVKIIDFGIAKIYNDQKIQETNLSVDNQFLGTFRYASPEQWESRKELDGRSDIYSLGIILYEMLSGTDPFDSNTNKSGAISIAFWARAHTQVPPIPLRSQPGCEHISREIEAVVMRCLEKSPDSRFASVADLGRAIIQAAVANNLPLNIAVPQTTPQNVSNITEAETAFSQSSPPIAKSDTESFAESIFPLSTPSKKTDRIQNAFAPELYASKTTQASTPLPNQTNQINQATSIATATDHPPGYKPLLLRLAIGTGIVALLTGGYVYWQGQNRNSAAVVSLNDINALKSQAKYEECIATASSVARDANIYADTQIILNQCRLERAKQLAMEQKFDVAFATIKQIPANSSVYNQSQNLAKQWSEQIITQATSKYQKGDFKVAIALLEAIPQTSPTHAKVQTTISSWKKDWQLAEQQYNAAKLELSKNNPQAAIEAASKIPKITFWQDKVKSILNDAKARIAKNSQPAIVSPSNTSPAPANSTPTDPASARIPDSTGNVERQRPTFDPPPEPERNPVVAPPPGRTWEDDPSSNQHNTNPNNDGGI
jgi:eukaryotic-like serine/threonine-protein kinase